VLLPAEADAAPSRDMIGMAATARPAKNLAFIYDSLLSGWERNSPADTA
jgi:hypothetical protein